MLTTLVGAAFADPDWLFEVTWDGVHVETVVDRGTLSASC
jgi:N-acetylglucosamine-6-phosphate deacetylase